MKFLEFQVTKKSADRIFSQEGELSITLATSPYRS